MRPATVPIPVLAVALHACTAEPELLNSERIEATFGSYGIEVLQNDAQLRRSSLYSIGEGVRTCRTYAVVQFLEQPGEQTQDEHTKIVSGGSIGEVFKSHGWRIYKQTLYTGNVTIDDKASDLIGLMLLGDDDVLAMHVYRLLLEKEDTSVSYATIIEVHHPEYLDLDDLRRLYPVSESTFLSQDQVSALVSLVTDTETE